MKRMRWIIAGVAVAASAALLGSVITAPAYAETVFGDTYADGDANGWSRSGGSWSVGTDGFPVLRQSSTSANARILAGATSWTDYTLQARVKPITFGASDRTVGVAARVQSSTAYYALVLTGGGAAQLQRVSGGAATVLATAATGTG